MTNLTVSSDRSVCGARRSRAIAWPVALVFACLSAAVLVAGCKSTSPAHYIAPRVEGRVLDARTHQPLGGVTVRRIDPGANTRSGDVPKGGQSLKQTPAVRTRSDGAFALDSERNLELFRRSGWYGVTLSFEHAGYAPFTTNYIPTNATTSPRGEPEVQAGDILLVPLSQ